MIKPIHFPYCLGWYEMEEKKGRRCRTRPFDPLACPGHQHQEGVTGNAGCLELEPMLLDWNRDPRTRGDRLQRDLLHRRLPRLKILPKLEGVVMASNSLQESSRRKGLRPLHLNGRGMFITSFDIMLFQLFIFLNT